MGTSILGRSAPVVGFERRRDLLVPGAATKQVAVDQHDGLAGAMILVMDLDVCVVSLTDSDRGHGASFLWLAWPTSALQGQAPADLICRLAWPQSRAGRARRARRIPGRCPGLRPGPHPGGARPAGRE